MTALTQQAASQPVRSESTASRVAVVLLALLLGVCLLAALNGGHVAALTAAGGFKGSPISGVEGLVSKLQGSVVWLGATVMGLVIAVVAIMFMVGHSRAHDLALKTCLGLFILASISGIVA